MTAVRGTEGGPFVEIVQITSDTSNLDLHMKDDAGAFLCKQSNLCDILCVIIFL